jgi:hypothetical protein
MTNDMSGGIVLCGKPGRCCPVLGLEGKKYYISDKGQKVLFTKGQLKLLCKTLKGICGCD